MSFNVTALLEDNFLCLMGRSWCKEKKMLEVGGSRQSAERRWPARAIKINNHLGLLSLWVLEFHVVDNCYSHISTLLVEWTSHHMFSNSPRQIITSTNLVQINHSPRVDETNVSDHVIQ